MDEITKALVSPILGFAGGYLSYVLQTSRNKKIDSRSKIKLVRRLLLDYIADTERTRVAFLSNVKEIEQNILVMPEAILKPHPSVNMLSSCIYEEVFQNAFSRVFAGALEGEKYYDILREHIWESKLLVDTIAQLYSNAESYANGNSDKIIELMKRVVTGEKEYATSADKDAVTDSKMNVIFSNYRMKGTAKDYIELSEIKQLLIDPLTPIISSAPALNVPLKAISDSLREINFILQENGTNHRELCGELNEKLPLLQNSITQLQSVYSFLTNRQISNLYT